MASVPAAHRSSSSSLRTSSWGGLSSMLRLAANEQRAQTGGRHGLLQGLARALRAAGPDARARPMHALLAGVDFADTRLPGG